MCSLNDLATFIKKGMVFRLMVVEKGKTPEEREHADDVQRLWEEIEQRDAQRDEERAEEE